MTGIAGVTAMLDNRKIVLSQEGFPYVLVVVKIDIYPTVIERNRHSGQVVGRPCKPRRERDLVLFFVFSMRLLKMDA